jgi:hypothetical protein
MKAILIISLTVFVCSCSNWKHAYNLDPHETQKNRGYHAITANKIITKNAKNRKTNLKAAEKKRVDDNKTQATLNQSRTKKHTKPSGVFMFYTY